MYFKKRELSYPLPFIKLIPSVITLVGLSVGVSSIRYALEARWEMAVICIFTAVLIDGIDGRIARLLGATSSFGMELDSLCDFMNFGLSASLIIYLWLIPNGELKLISWGSVLIFIICAAIRLARFNTTSTTSTKINNISKYFFVGVPAPIGALLGLMPLIIDFEIAPKFNLKVNSYTLFVNAYLLIIGCLMASRIPTFSIKHIIIKPEYIWIYLLIFAVISVALSIYPWYVIPGFAFIYIITIPISIILARRIN